MEREGVTRSFFFLLLCKHPSCMQSVLEHLYLLFCWELQNNMPKYLHFDDYLHFAYINHFLRISFFCMEMIKMHWRLFFSGRMRKFGDLGLKNNHVAFLLKYFLRDEIRKKFFVTDNIWKFLILMDFFFVFHLEEYLRFFELPQSGQKNFNLPQLNLKFPFNWSQFEMKIWSIQMIPFVKIIFPGVNKLLHNSLKNS